MYATLLTFACASAAPAQSRSSSELTFSGEIQQVTPVSVSVRLPDARIIDARNVATAGELSPEKLAASFSIGDRVEISCASIPGVYEERFARVFLLELKGIRLLRRPTAAEAAKSLASPAWRESCRDEDGSAVECNLLQPPERSQPLPAGSLLRAIPLPDARDGVAPDRPSPPSSQLDQIRSRVLDFVATMANFVGAKSTPVYPRIFSSSPSLHLAMLP